MQKEPLIFLSVRGVVEFALRHGDIDGGFSGLSSMKEGIKIHNRIQKERKKKGIKEGFDYASEVPLSTEIHIDGFVYRVDGRADGLAVYPGGRHVVEEIKSTGRDIFRLAEEPDLLHLAQAKFYAYMICVANELKEAGITIIYADIDPQSRQTATAQLDCTFHELKDFVTRVIEIYHPFAKWDYNRKAARNQGIKASPFPYGEYRKGQREFAVMVYRAIEGRKNLFMEAPTGTGKTISALFPAVKALGERLTKRIFYLTAKTIARQAAEKAVGIMSGAGFPLFSISLTAKDKTCPLPERICSPAYCPRAKGHYDRINTALWDMLQKEENIDREKLLAHAEAYNVCPHELCLDLTLFADIIIGDYNYVFDPQASLKRFFGENAVPGENTLLIDEAHNMDDRAREMFSSELNKEDFLALRRLVKERDRTLYKSAGKINKIFQQLSFTGGQKEAHMTLPALPEGFEEGLLDFCGQCDRLLPQLSGERGELYNTLLEQYFRVLAFLGINELYYNGYAIFCRQYKGGQSIRLMCLNAAPLLAETLKLAAGAVFFSATLTPIEYFRSILGGRQEDLTARLPSPFNRENLRVVVEGGISTRYKDREESYDKIALCIERMFQEREGNYMAFFSSYDYMEKVYRRFQAFFPDIDVVVQSRGMEEGDKESFLSCFSESRESGLLGFTVLGGIFSEGIDLVGKRLIGVAVVGVGLPMISPERDLLANYYGDEGFRYAYMYPGMNKVLQAAGRVIRSARDKGVVVLIDDRFLTPAYQGLFPWHWGHFKAAWGNVAPFLREYWDNIPLDGSADN